MTDLHALNRSYLIVVRDAIKSNPVEACATFNIDSELCDALASMSLSSIESVAETNVVLFRPSISGKCILQLAESSEETARTVIAALSGVRNGK